MKITAEPKVYTPVTIVLDTEAEFNALMFALDFLQSRKDEFTHTEVNRIVWSRIDTAADIRSALLEVAGE